ncbi:MULTISPECIES: preprotein translocase subunit SecA [Kosmotoga]|uniref:Protein translocase subunit SecA n=1 Tax=Kosmotoga olearia (strain ATCC BAA-1733 / DSM 21960 / TBF 19.5.1) TaxID=521045 RepID=C5CGS5_KOSOT|nr:MULTISPECIES: preprotein translocase subunit SecA [Kosmotoga]ACR80594.1 preprotein translocase, SecA subunit [Kosmotoga olearia TBF 19.5.1]MDI3523275.1 preprotein translocase subunit SecA [Kosmotoga sp.]MDK2952795.1 preprotein translocase subunit SecA [Kosmotoga sp.]
MKILGKLFDKNKRTLKRYDSIVKKVNALEKEVREYPAEKFPQKTRELKERIKKGEPLDNLLPEAFALVRESARRTVGMRHFDVQVMGAIALHEGKIAEMKTGEGKTLVATMPLYLNALTGKNVQLATVNDYLARRDAAWMGPVYEYLGLTVGYIQSSMDTSDRKKAYQSDVTYGTANEFGFDYLRDNLVYSLEQKVQRDHYYVIVDEADSILIDEARTPLIISGPAEASSELYRKSAFYARRFVENEDFIVNEKEKTVSLTDKGIEKAERLFGIDNLYDPNNYTYLFHLLNALKARTLFKKDVDYIVSNGEVIIVDEFTGRLLPGRRYSEGLHQAIEAKENVKIKEESITYATITFQNYFKMYEKLAGMTGTAATEEAEFVSIYGCEVVVIPTNKPVLRKDKDDLVFRTVEEKYAAIVEEIEKRYKKGQPVLVGTTSIEKSEYLSSLLRKKGIPHEVLNAKHHEREAEIVAKAGEKGTVTIATNMAGRGTDIKLGEGVKELGGLFVLGTERHESRRIDNQLIGRSGRQGDPGESRFFLSLEDDLIRLFGGEKLKGIMDTLKIEKGEPIEHPLLSRIINSAQKKIEGIHFSIRKRLYELDSVVDKQRSAIYAHRDWLLRGEDIDKHIHEIIEDTVTRRTENWETVPAYEEIKTSFGFLPERILEGVKSCKKPEELTNILIENLKKEYEEKKKAFGDEFPNVLKYLMLRMIDERWRKHLEAIEHLKDSVGLRAYGQKDPVIEFKKESYILFEEMVDSLYDDIVSVLVRLIRIDSEKTREKAQKELQKLNFVHNEFSALKKDGGKRSKEKKHGTHSRRFKVKR